MPDYCWALLDETAHEESDTLSLLGLFVDPATALAYLRDDVGFDDVAWENKGYNPGFWEGWSDGFDGEERYFVLAWQPIRGPEADPADAEPPPEHLAQLPRFVPAG